MQKYAVHKKALYLQAIHSHIVRHNTEQSHWIINKLNAYIDCSMLET